MKSKILLRKMAIKKIDKTWFSDEKNIYGKLTSECSEQPRLCKSQQEI